MKNKKKLDEKTRKILKGLELVYERLVQFKRSKNSPIIVSRNGKIVELNPFEVPDKITDKN